MLCQTRRCPQNFIWGLTTRSLPCQLDHSLTLSLTHPLTHSSFSRPLCSLIKFRLGAHTLRVETDRWLIPKPPREQRVCRHCTMQAIEDEQHFLFDCPFYSIIRGQHFSLFGPNYQQRDIRLFFEQNAHQLGSVAHHIHLCFQARMSDESHLAPHPDCKA